MGNLKKYNDDRDLIPFFAWYSGFSPDMCARLWRNTFQSDLNFPRDIPVELLESYPEDLVDEALWWDNAVESFMHWVKAYKSGITKVIPFNKGDYYLALSDMSIASVLHGKEIQIDTNDGYDGSHYPKYRSLPYDLHQECLSAIYAVIRKRINALNDELADALEAETLAMQDEINKLRNR